MIGNLPNGWSCTSLENVVEILDRKRIPLNNTERQKRIEGKDNTELFPYYGATGQVGYIDDYIFDVELVLLGEDGAPFFDFSRNKAYIIRGKTWVNNHAHVLQAIDGIITNQFLCNFLNFFDYHGFVTGTTRLKLNQSRMRKIQLLLPPINEQKRIVYKIEELFTKLDAGIQELTLAKEKLKVYRQSVLKHAFEGKLTEEWRKTHKDEIEDASVSLKKIENNLKKELGKKYKPFQPRNIEEIAILPEEWEWATYSQIGDLISGQHIKTQDYNMDSDGMPYLTGPADFTSKYPLVTKWTPKPKAKALKNDVMITVKGAGVGKVNVLDIEEAAISRQLMAIRATEFDQNYIFYYIKSNFYYFQKLGSSSTVPGINRDQILKSVIPVPPLFEQKEIGNEISRIFSLIENMEINIDYGIKQAKKLRQSILKKAFSGQLVPQDHNDEPAQKLLERIKAQKEKQKPKRKSKQKRLVK